MPGIEEQSPRHIELQASAWYSASEHINDALRKSIYSGVLAPGTRLIERQIAEQFQVSNIPVREALLQLVQAGLVERVPRRGARVTSLDRRDIDEICSLRAVLEQLVVARVIDRWSSGAETELRTLVSEMVRHASADDVEMVFELDCAFHERLWQLSDHATLMELAALLRSRINGFLFAANRALPRYRLRQHALEHGRLIDAIASHDVARATSAMTGHVQDAAQRIHDCRNGTSQQPESRKARERSGGAA